MRHTGKPIYAYLLDFRIGEAINLLENTRMSVSEISSAVGFCDISHFSKTFKNNLFWVAGQFIMQVIVLMGWLPILGL